MSSAALADCLAAALEAMERDDVGEVYQQVRNMVYVLAAFTTDAERPSPDSESGSRG